MRERVLLMEKSFSSSIGVTVKNCGEPNLHRKNTVLTICAVCIWDFDIKDKLVLKSQSKKTVVKMAIWKKFLLSSQW